MKLLNEVEKGGSEIYDMVYLLGKIAGVKE